MTRTHVAVLLALLAVLPAAAAGPFLSTPATPDTRPCVFADNGAYRIASGTGADFTVRVVTEADAPGLHLQLVDDPAAADFVLVDDGDDTAACRDASAVKSVHIDPAASAPDMTVALSREPAAHKIFVRSTFFSAQDAAALFAVIHKSRLARTAQR